MHGEQDWDEMTSGGHLIPKLSAEHLLCALCIGVKWTDSSQPEGSLVWLGE